MLFINNPDRAATGGTCFGDSGGPTFMARTNEIVAVNSFALNQSCKGIWRRLPHRHRRDQTFIEQFL